MSGGIIFCYQFNVEKIYVTLLMISDILHLTVADLDDDESGDPWEPYGKLNLRFPISVFIVVIMLSFFDSEKYITSACYIKTVLLLGRVIQAQHGVRNDSEHPCLLHNLL